MRALFHNLRNDLSAFEHWFDRHFGWFFTNGMKQQRGGGRGLDERSGAH